jgi:hypothetical protein
VKKVFFAGVLAGCVFTAAVFTGYRVVHDFFSKQKKASPEVQQQIIRNIEDTDRLLAFADDNLADCTDILFKIRAALLSAGNGSSIGGDKKEKIINLSGDYLQLLEESTFNTIPVFYADSTRMSDRVIPVPLDPEKPSYTITLSCRKFDRAVLTAFINGLTPGAAVKNSITALDSLVAAVALERAQIDAYRKRLSYSQETAAALTKTTVSERRDGIRTVIQKIKTERLVLCVKSADGIYCAEDRQQMQVTVNELTDELHRITALIQKSGMTERSISLSTQADAEQAMRYFAKNVE